MAVTGIAGANTTRPPRQVGNLTPGERDGAEWAGRANVSNSQLSGWKPDLLCHLPALGLENRPRRAGVTEAAPEASI